MPGINKLAVTKVRDGVGCQVHGQGPPEYRVPRLVRARTIASDHPGPEACKGSSTKLKVALPSPSKSLHGLADN